MRNLKILSLLTITLLFLNCKESNSQENKTTKNNIETTSTSSDYKEYRSTTSNEIGDEMTNKLWKPVYTDGKGIPQGVFKSNSNLFLYVMRPNENKTEMMFHKYKYDLNGNYLSKSLVEKSEIEYLKNKKK